MGSFNVKVSGSGNVTILVDGFYSAWTLNLGTNGSSNITVQVPNDGMDHRLVAVDDGTQGAVSTAELQLPRTSCTGALLLRYLGSATHPVTKETHVKIKASHTGIHQEPLAAGISVPGLGTVLFETLNAKEERVLTFKLPADGVEHHIDGTHYRSTPGGGFTGSRYPHLSVTVRSNQPPPPAEDPIASAPYFSPGETVFVRSAPGSTPMATDGSEWVLLEIRKRPESGQPVPPWKLTGTEKGFVLPSQDGSWSSSIQTNSATFPVGSKWDLRTRRFREFRSSNESLQYFNMGSAPIPKPQLDRPYILAPLTNQSYDTWVTLAGTGTPGSIIEFSATDKTAAPSPPQVPPPTTVGSDGMWSSRITEHPVDPNNYYEYRHVVYRARASLNGEATAWSDGLSVNYIGR
ncbi:hypothetical protein ACIBG8_19630 [Nonomuraea sp. NPDC050556]|uniref:hypothetical protein n=1 Tax=Nonomuraea sp. NPDC050556 TaxID=3364369 RepID=UPI0037897274